MSLWVEACGEAKCRFGLEHLLWLLPCSVGSRECCPASIYLSYLFLPAYLSYILPLTCHRVAAKVILGLGTPGFPVPAVYPCTQGRLRPRFCDFVPFGTGISKAGLWVQKPPHPSELYHVLQFVQCLNESLRAVVLKLECTAESCGGAC